MSRLLATLVGIAVISAAYVASSLLAPAMGAILFFAVIIVVFAFSERQRRRRAQAETSELKQLVSDHREAVRELAEANRLLLMTEQTAHVGHWEVDLVTERLYWSDETCRIHGLPPGPAPALATAISVYHPDDQQMVVDHVDQAIATGQGYRFEARLVRPDGEIRNVEAIAKVQHDDDGNPISMFGTFRDRTEELARETELKQALRDARHAAQSKTRFLANMSHEIRTPMNGLLGFTELLLADDLTETQRKYASLIGDSGRSMLTLLNDILDISKIEAGSLEIAEEPVDVRAKLHYCADVMRAGAMAKDISIETSVADDVPMAVVGDKLRFRQILLNLAGNAVKFTNSGEIRLSARRERGLDGDDDWLVVDVADTGIGIAENKIERLFDNFRQAEASTARRFGGTGLGLSISRNLARLMGGDVTATSVVGEGSVFKLRIPLRAIETDEQPDAVIEEAVEPSPAVASTRLLVVEDNEINQMLIEAMCDRLGVDHALASNGAEALRMVKHADAKGCMFDLVLMDIQMPEMDGFEATRRLRNSGFDAERLPIVALTANAYAEDIEACRQAGMQDHLTKPVTLHQVEAMVARHVPKLAEAMERAKAGDDKISVTA